MYSMFEINVLCSVPILFCPSLSLIVVHTLAHRLLSSHRGKYPPSVRKMEWNRWHQNDWNHLQWFPQLSYLSTRPSLLCWLLLSPPPLRPCSRVPAQLHPSPGCIVPVSSMPSRLTGLAKAAQAHWKPRGATQSQPRGEREEGGVQGGEDIGRKGGGEGFWCFFFSPPPPTGSLALISAAVFLAHRIFSWKYQRICTKSHFESLPHMLKCQIHKQTCVCTILSPFKQLSSFWTNSSSPFFSPLSSPPLRSTLACHTSPSPGPDCRAPVM